MGLDYESFNRCEPYQYDSFIPFFNFSGKEENKKKLEKKSETKIIDKEKEYLNLKNSNFSKINSRSRKSTIDLDEQENLKNNYKKEDIFKKVFTDPNNSTYFSSKKYNDSSNEDDYNLVIYENENFRTNYYAKLIYKNIWTPGIKKKTHNTLFIFDWDDTLFPTSYLIKNGIIDNDDLSEGIQELFFILEETLINILNFASNKGDVYIITNSSMSWFIYSFDKYFKNLAKIIEMKNVISARDDYERDFPGNNKIWKEKAFINLTKNINDKLVTNILCFGDSTIELEAGKILASKLRDSFIKTIKFKENPDMEDLIKQLNLVFDKIEYIYSKAKNLSIIIEEKA